MLPHNPNQSFQFSPECFKALTFDVKTWSTSGDYLVESNLPYFQINEKERYKSVAGFEEYDKGSTYQALMSLDQLNKFMDSFKKIKGD